MRKFSVLFIALVAFAGCQKKLVDVETPVGDVEVTENTVTDDVDVDVDGNE